MLSCHSLLSNSYGSIPLTIWSLSAYLFLDSAFSIVHEYPRSMYKHCMRAAGCPPTWRIATVANKMTCEMTSLQGSIIDLVNAVNSGGNARTKQYLVVLQIVTTTYSFSTWRVSSSWDSIHWISQTKYCQMVELASATDTVADHWVCRTIGTSTGITVVKRLRERMQQVLVVALVALALFQPAMSRNAPLETEETQSTASELWAHVHIHMPHVYIAIITYVYTHIPTQLYTFFMYSMYYTWNISQKQHCTLLC